MCGIELMFSPEPFWQLETRGSGSCKDSTCFLETLPPSLSVFSLPLLSAKNPPPPSSTRSSQDSPCNARTPRLSRPSVPLCVLGS